VNGDTVTTVSPGIGAFLAFFALAIALWLLMRNMNARMRRMSYRAEEAQREAESKGAQRPAGEADGREATEEVTPAADDEGEAEGDTGGTRP
jgi:hypothetical protein